MNTKYQLYDRVNVCRGRNFLAFISRRLNNKPMVVQPRQGRGLERCVRGTANLSFYLQMSWKYL